MHTERYNESMETASVFKTFASPFSGYIYTIVSVYGEGGNSARV